MPEYLGVEEEVPAALGAALLLCPYLDTKGASPSKGIWILKLDLPDIIRTNLF